MPDITCCFTTYPPRAKNIPAVLDNMRKQTCAPSRYIMTLARQDEQLRDIVAGMRDVEVHIVEQDTGVWKKWLPVSELLAPNELILTIDDDLLFPTYAVEELVNTFAENPQRPVSGNHYWHNGLKCHCGAFSLVRPYYYRGWQQYYELWRSVKSSDMFYTMLAANNKHTYAQTWTDWPQVAEAYNDGVAYTRKGMVQVSYEQIARVFGWIK